METALRVMIETHYFDVDEANRTLPLVRRIVADILKAGQDIRAISVDTEKPEEDPRIVALMDELDTLFEEIKSLGCSYKDWNFQMGLVDFPAIVAGQEAYLCWRSDEPQILFYHDAESGYAGRRPLPKEGEAA
jgi:hypothetical protein